MYPLIRMMWGEKGFWDMLPPAEPGGGYPVRFPLWTYYNVNFSVKSKIIKPFIFDTMTTSLIKRFFMEDFPMKGKLQIPISKEIEMIAPKYAWLDESFNIFSSVKRDYNIDFNMIMMPTSVNINIINLLKNLDKINLIDYVDD
jgi:hypothetical protein